MNQSYSTASAEYPVLSTKLFAPMLGGETVGRDRLLQRLDQATGLIVVSAPAGFGKSTLVGDWLQQRPWPSAWLSLEPADGELRRFLGYLAGALAQLSEAAGASLRPLLNAPRLPPPEAALVPVINALGAQEADTVLVLDDFHVIDNEEVHQLVAHWTHHLPPGFRLVICTRADPPFSLARLRGQGRLTELRARDLRFSPQESSLFLRQAMGLDLHPRLTRALQQRTEGWIAGLQLAALSLRGQEDAASFVEAFSGSHRYVLDYLTEEVLHRQPPEVLDFLLPVSLLQRFCAELCDAMLERESSHQLLRQMEADNLFLIPLDQNRRWFRFHHLFRELLRQTLENRLDPEARAALHRRASDWLLAQNLPTEALEQALAARDRGRALDILALHAGPALERGDAASVAGWFEAVPQEWVEAAPQVALTQALMLFMTMRWKELAQASPQLERALAEDLEDRVRGSALTLAACSATVRTERAEAIAAARGALELLAPEDRLLRAVAAITLGTSLLAQADYDAASEAFHQAAAYSRAGGDQLGIDATSHFYQGRLQLLQGRTHEALRIHREAAAEGFGEGSSGERGSGEEGGPMTCLPILGEAEVRFEWGELERAQKLVEEGLAINRDCFPFNEVMARLILLEVARARRDFSSALSGAELLLDILRQASLLQWEPQAQMHRLRTIALRACLEDDPVAWEEWREWIETSGLLDDDDVEAKLLPELPRTATVSLGIRWLERRGDAERAARWARELRSVARRHRWHRAIIESWLLEAMARRHRDAEAVAELLQEAFQLAEEGRFVQVLADEKEWLGELPGEVLAPALEKVTPAFRRRLLEALEIPSTGPSGTQLPELLSPREREVLAEVARGGTNETVGEALFISPSTVKKHLENIYGKLGVHNRQEAVHRAQSLGLLPAPHDPAPDPISDSGSSSE
ncbi:MAG: LuxR C-terminal-related transcriptional regulator [Acidobacteriota bacterium]|nr:LuxR C-terminal-related transcriptional regulator [Acidobacteriota bacterium]